MPLSELEEYFRKRRVASYEKKKPIKSIRWRKVIHPLFLLGLWISRIAAGEKLYILEDNRISTNKPLIYACTHIGGMMWK